MFPIIIIKHLSTFLSPAPFKNLSNIKIMNRNIGNVENQTWDSWVRFEYATSDQCCPPLDSP